MIAYIRRLREQRKWRRYWERVFQEQWPVTEQARLVWSDRVVRHPPRDGRSSDRLDELLVEAGIRNKIVDTDDLK